MNLSSMRQSDRSAEATPAGDRPKILVFLQGYLPGYLAGGPIRSIANMVSALGREFEFLIVTSDRDYKAESPYAGVRTGQWTQVGEAQVLYVQPGLRGLWTLLRAARKQSHQIIYLNSFFSRRFSMLPLLLWKLKIVPGCSLVLAPRGEFSRGALQLKSWRKHAYLWVAKMLGMCNTVIWHASTHLEAGDVRRVWHSAVDINVAAPLQSALTPATQFRRERTGIMVASDLPDIEDDVDFVPCPKHPSKLDIVFVSRISRMKNLDGALAILKQVQGAVRFDIYGPVEDRAYWAECCELIESMPPNVVVRHHGPLPPNDVRSVLSRHHLFFLPTRGENYGHVIVEALGVGRPVLISDQTPWQGLEQFAAGWSIPLDEPSRFRSVLQECVDMEETTFSVLCQGARHYLRERSDYNRSLCSNRDLWGCALRASVWQGRKSVTGGN